jgi:hypothetical protein
MEDVALRALVSPLLGVERSTSMPPHIASAHPIAAQLLASPDPSLPPSVRTQVAVVRALLDQLERTVTSAEHAGEVEGQVVEELARLSVLGRRDVLSDWASEGRRALAS